MLAKANMPMIQPMFNSLCKIKNIIHLISMKFTFVVANTW